MLTEERKREIMVITLMEIMLLGEGALDTDSIRLKYFGDEILDCSTWVKHIHYPMCEAGFLNVGGALTYWTVTDEGKKFIEEWS